MKRTVVIGSMVAILALFVLVGTVLAGPKGTDRPFKGSGSGTSSVPVLVAGNFPTFGLTGTGTFNATHLGQGTYTGASTQDWSGADYTGFPNPVNPCAVVAGSITLTAANGDTLTGDIVAGSTVCELAPFNGLAYASTLIIDFTGGTGRFVDASGSFVSTNIHIRPTVTSPSQDTGSWVGTTSY